MKKTLQFAVGSLVTVSLILYFLYLAFYHAENLNTDITLYDQNAYMRAVREIHENNWWHLGDRNRMPLYQYFQALFYSPKLAVEQHFLLGKTVNIVLSITLLFVIFHVVKRYLGNFPGYVYTLLVAFCLFVYKAPYFQAEVLFNFFNLLSFIFVLKLLDKSRWQDTLVAGLMLGLAYLSKSSALLLMQLVVVFLIVRWFIALVQKQKPRRHFLLILLFVGTFILVISPYLLDSKRIFGKFFYNVNTTFYIWQDPNNSQLKNPKWYGDRVGWPQLSDEELPSLRNYLANNNLTQILDREIKGLVHYKNMYLHQTAMTATAAKYVGLMVILAIIYRLSRNSKTKSFSVKLATASLSLLYLSIYVLIPQAYSLPRVMMSLFPLLMFIAYYAFFSWPIPIPIRSIMTPQLYFMIISSPLLINALRRFIIGNLQLKYYPWLMLKTVLLYLVAFTVFSFVLPRAWSLLKIAWQKHWLVVLFVLTYAAVYILAYAWYVPIGNTPRFTASLFPPLLYASFLALNLFKDQRLEFSLKRASFSIPIINLFHFGLLLFTSLDVYRVGQYFMQTFIFGG